MSVSMRFMLVVVFSLSVSYLFLGIAQDSRMDLFSASGIVQVHVEWHLIVPLFIS